MSPLVLAEDLLWSSKRGRSKMNRKRINRNKLFRIILQIEKWIAICELNLTAPRKWVFPPQRIHVVHSAGKCSDGYSDLCAGAALAYLNQREKVFAMFIVCDCNLYMGPKLEFVEALGCMFIERRRILHSNFIAKPIGGSEADKKLFFAELAVPYRRTIEEKEDDMDKGVTRERHSFLTCTRPPDIIQPFETGLYDCKTCGRYPGYVKRPNHGLFAESEVVNTI